MGASRSANSSDERNRPSQSRPAPRRRSGALEDSQRRVLDSGGDDNVLPILLAQAERKIYGAGEWGVQSGDVVLDVGAYIGTWTRQALALGAKQVVSIEPSPASIECLKRNLAAEIASGKVILVPKGIWDSEGKLTFFENSTSGVGNSFVENERRHPNAEIPFLSLR